MSLTSADRALTRATRSVLKGAGAQLAGKNRGPDHDPEGRRRVPHAGSFDADDDPKAKPWRPVGDGSYRQGQVFREALIKAAEEDYQLEYAQTDFAELRHVRRMHIALTAELKTIERDPYGSVAGRRATLRIELARLEAVLEREAIRLRRVDVDVLQGVLEPICFRTGKLFPSLDWIARRAGCHRNSVIAALRRLKARGYLDWVRRTVKTWSEDALHFFREQTSNAYFFEHRQKMRPRLWHRFTQILAAKLRRLGCVPAGVDAGEPSLDIAGPLGRALAGLGAAIDAADHPLADRAQ